MIINDTNLLIFYIVGGIILIILTIWAILGTRKDK